MVNKISMKMTLSLLSLIFSNVLFAQINWNYSAKKIADKTYEVHITATVNEPWHIYSQTTPDGGPVATEIIFNKNPLIINTGKPKELGKMKEKHEDVFGVDVRYYEGKVDFVQVIKLKSNVKTNLSGRVEFMLCNDRECMPPKTVQFSIRLE